MIRVLFASAVPVLSLAMAAAFLGGDILREPTGEPLMVEAPGVAKFQQAGFDGSVCSNALLFGDDASADESEPGHRIIGMVVRVDADGFTIDVEEHPVGAERGEAFVLFLDSGGHLIAAEPASDFPDVDGCLPLPDPTKPGPA